MASFPTTTKILRTVKVVPGEKILLPEEANIVSLAISGAISVESSCDNLPTPEPFLCYKMSWSFNNDLTGSPNLEYNDNAKIEYVSIAGTEYPIGETFHSGYTEETTLAAFRDKIQSPVFVPNKITWSTSGERTERTIHFQTIESVAESIEMKIVGVGYTDGLYVKAVPSEECV